ncbi:NAD(P)H-binding protein [Rubrobacter tropicus]|uniref:NAD(P)H-binding protein n=1 Tax=Rubrobacter tropicus TaxID=2653851 RepID=A0A6G8QEH4_9ACTN|nr:SDR family oxidoreductase [Rubrobacter tropicus]QIN84905.1 NAD(P)H-binding protein [Rubrobacter tropicus]
MKVLVFGATGSVGRHIVEQGLARGHEVTAFVRDPSGLEVGREGLNVFEGDVLEPASVEAAVRGQEAVLCSIGAGRRGGVRSEGTRNIVRAMEEAGVRRFVCQTTLGAGESSGNLNFFWKHVMFGLLLREAFADHEQQEAHVRKSGLDWTIVRPAAFTDGGRTGEYRHGFSPDEREISLKISRADVADFMLDQSEDGTYLREAPGLSY